MTKRPLICLLFVMTFLAAPAFADSFEFLNFTPPVGWVSQPAQEGSIYRRVSGVGLVYFYPSYASTGTATDEFPKMWSARVEPSLPGPPPPSKTQSDRDYAVAVGAKQFDTKGSLTTVVLVSIVGRGRAICVLGMAEGNDILREVSAFLDSLNVNQNAPTSTIIDVEFTVPPNYVAGRDGPRITFQPKTLNAQTSCVYGLSPARASSGTLERDARVAILEAVPGWQLKSERYFAMRGTAPDGWPYFWYQTDIQQMNGATMQYLTAMTMAFPAGEGRVNMLWGFGPPQSCTLNDVAFVRLLNSLRPRGWAPDGGKAFTQQLVGTWRNTEAAGMAQYKFLANGNYEYGQGTSTTFSTRETRTGSVGDGTYAMRGPELTLTGRRPGKYLVRVYDEFNGGIWLKTMALLNDGANPPFEVRYLRVNN